MGDSVPGPDVLRLEPPAEGIPAPSQIDRYQTVLSRLATPYVLNAQRRAVPSTHTTTTLTPASGAITTARDYAKFDLALKRGEIVRTETLSASWQAPMGRNNQRLPHGVGWFVQTFNGEPIVWQFGVSDSGSSSMVMMAPGRGLTLVLLANSPGLVRPFALDKGDLVASPFGRLFLGMLVR
jgi:CubicO group peptidase (beta-lactamase class C family)